MISTPPSSLRVSCGACTRTGERASNEDCVSWHEGTAQLIAAVADGLGGHRGGHVAAQVAAHGFIDALLGLPATLGAQAAGSRALASLNGWLHAQGRADPALAHAASTLTALVLRGRRAHVLHVGDSRAYRWRDGRLQQLTDDHVHEGREQRHVLTRALGLELTVRADARSVGLRAHDRLLLCSDGVHGAMSATQLASLARPQGSPAEDAERIVEAALAGGGQDNASAIVIDVLEVAAAGRAELHSRHAALPIRPPPRAGETLDGFELRHAIAQGRYGVLFEAEDQSTGQRVALKFPGSEVREGNTAHEAFLREAWICSVLRERGWPTALDLAEGRQTLLYLAMPFHEGHTLETLLHRRTLPSLAECVQVGVQLCNAVAFLHRAGIVHRDIKPENVLVRTDGRLTLLDLGAARLLADEPLPGEAIPGTPGYLAPEFYAGASLGDAATDQFAVGVTLYRLLTRHFPFGEVEPFMQPRFNRLAPLEKHRPDLPAWIGHCLSRAMALPPADRYQDLLELAHELEAGLARSSPVQPRRTSLYARAPVRFWQVTSALLLIALLLVLALRTGR